MKFTTELRIKSYSDHYKIKPINPADDPLFEKLLKTRRDGDNTVISVTFELQERARTFSQLKTVWALVGVIFQSDSENNRKGTAEELYALYEDLLQVYADKTVNRLNGELRSIRISEADSGASARFIEGLMIHLTHFCSLKMDTETEVRGLLHQWELWRGKIEDDPLDQGITEKEWREKHPYSQASGKPGQIERAHIISRGADKADIEEPWNWMALTSSEHQMQHNIGWVNFLKLYPHLAPRVERARIKAGKLELEGGK